MPNSVKKHGEIIPANIRATISSRYCTITQAINKEFWERNSETEHSYYVGSYGRGTAIDDSDVDLMVVLPKEEYERFDRLNGNGQSSLLQSVKGPIDESYPRTDVRADGQVVVLEFSDGMKIEVLPAFDETSWYGIETIYTYPDSNMGGHWESTNPLAEQKAMQEKNLSSNGLLFDTCKHIRRLHLESFKSYHLSGILIDSFVYEAMKAWRWTPPEQTPNPSAVSYEQTLLDYYNMITCNGLINMEIQAPGSGMTISASDDSKCLGKILKAMVE